MYKWTDEDHELVKILTAQGLTVAQISDETGLTVGSIKRSRTINRITAANLLTNKPQSDELIQLRVRIEELEKYISKLERAKAKRQDYEDADKPRLVFGKK